MRLTARTIIILVVASLCAIAPAGATPTKAEARVAAAAAAFATTTARHQAGTAPADAVYVWSVRWLDAQREQPLKGKALAAAAAAHLERMVALVPTLRRLLPAHNTATAELARLTASRGVLSTEKYSSRKAKHRPGAMAIVPAPWSG